MRVRQIVVCIVLAGMLMINACGGKNDEKMDEKQNEVTEAVSETEDEEYISGLSEETVLAISSRFGGIDKDKLTEKNWGGNSTYMTEDTWDNNKVFNLSYELTVGGHIKKCDIRSGCVSEGDVEAGKHTELFKAVADGFSDADISTKVNEYMNGYAEDTSLWNGGYSPVQIGNMNIGICGYKDENDADYHFDIYMEYAETQPEGVTVQDSAATNSSGTDLPDGQYRLDDKNIIYRVGVDIPTGVYHFENYSDDFKCIITDKNAEILSGNILDGYSKEKLDNRLIGYCVNADDAKESLYNCIPDLASKAMDNGKEVNYDELSASGTVSTSRPEVLDDGTQILLTRADCHILCAGGEAVLVLDEEYDQQKAIAAASQMDYGTWNGNDYTNEEFGINLHVSSSKKMGWRPSGEMRKRSLFVTGYNDTIEDMPPHVDVIDEVATLLVDIYSYTNSSMSVTVYDTTIPVSELMGNSFYNATPESYIQLLVDDNNNKARKDSEHYNEVTEIGDDTVFGMDAKSVTFVTKSDQPFGWEADADYNMEYNSVWVSKKEKYLIVTRLKFAFAQMDPTKDGADQYNKEKYEECMGVVSDILGEF